MKSKKTKKGLSKPNEQKKMTLKEYKEFWKNQIKRRDETKRD